MELRVRQRDTRPTQARRRGRSSTITDGVMSGKKKRGGRYPAEVRERAVRMVLDHEHEYPVQSISAKLDINHETLRNWVNRAEVDAGRKPGLTTDERARMKALEKENKELKRANEILKAASAFFGAELDRQSKK